MGQLKAAEPLLDEALAGRRRVLGDQHPSTLNALSHMMNVRRRLAMQTEE